MTVAGAPAHLPFASPTKPESADARDISLNGGFPNASGSSPVHPTVVAAEPDKPSALDVTPTGAHDDGATDSLEFGEPRFYVKNFSTANPQPSAPDVPIDSSLTTLTRTSSFPIISDLISEPDFYFLSVIKDAGFQNPLAGPLLTSIPGLRPIGTAANKASVLSFIIPGISNDSIARHLDKQGIAVRAGHHCALPAQRHFGLETTVRPSLAFYNTIDEVEALVSALHQMPRH